MTKKILKNVFIKSNFKIEQLYLKRLKKLYEKQERLQKFTKNCNNFILDVDITGAQFKKNALIFPKFFEEFDYIFSVQIFTPYEIWLNRILDRKINTSFKNSLKVRRILQDYFSLKSRDRRRAERTYYGHYEAWESYLLNKNIKNQTRVDTIQDCEID